MQHRVEFQSTGSGPHPLGLDRSKKLETIGLGQLFLIKVAPNRNYLERLFKMQINGSPHQKLVFSTSVVGARNLYF